MTVEKIDWLEYENKNHILAWVLVNAVFQKDVELFKEDGKFDSHNMTVEMKVNGVDVSFVEIMNALEDHLNGKDEEYHREVIEKAKEEIHEDLRYMTDLMRDFLERYTNVEKTRYEG